MPATKVHPMFLPDIDIDHLAEDIKAAVAHIDAAPPPNPRPGILWLNPDTGELYLYDASANPVCLTSGEPASVGGIKFRVNNDTLEYSADGGQTWSALSGGGALPPTEDVYYVLTEDYPRPDLQELGFDPLMVADGANWEFVVNAPWAARYGHTSVTTPDGRVWVIGGYDGGNRNDVWYSSNGTVWTQATSAASWSARYRHTSVVTPDGRIWVLGGHSYPSSYYNNVFYSSNGSSWTQATSAASWTARSGHTSVVTSDGRIWVIGGYSSTSPNYRCDVWYSTNGSIWSQATSVASWIERQGHTSVVTPDGRIWVIGGSGSKNDVWYSKRPAKLIAANG